MKDFIDVRNASYHALIPVGTRVKLTEHAALVSPRAAKHVGARGYVVDVSNDGFNGIMAFVELDYPDEIGKYVSVSTSALATAL